MFYKLTIISLLFTLNVYAQSHSIVVFSATGEVFQLSVDEKTINVVAPQSNVKAIGLNEGWHKLEIFQVHNNGNETVYKDSIYIREQPKYANKEFTYVLENKNKKPVLTFKSVSELSGPEKPIIPEVPKEVVPVVDNSVHGNLYQAKENKPVFFNHFDNTTNACDVNLSDSDLNHGINLITRCTDDESKNNYVNQIIKNNCLSVIQLQMLIATLPIEIDRLAAAKLAYNHLLDKHNSYLIPESFKYLAMKEAYLNDIKEQELKMKQQGLKCTTPMLETTFNELYQKIKTVNYENDKLKQAKKSLIGVCISSLQAKKIGLLFSHDREKLDFLLSAHPIITDKENEKLLVDEFQSIGTREEYLQLILK